jgi:GNAT superfamily N-acetyltransferase/predicted nucleic acid-binding protein
MAIHIETIDDASPMLEEVVRLWRANSNLLGFYPEGAFQERARKRQIIVARDGQICCGYVLYFTNQRRKAVITHLCVAEGHRGQNVAKRLVGALSDATKDMLGIGLRCRRDYPSWSAWPRLGFVATTETSGRSKDGVELTYFWLAHNHPDLFSTLRDRREILLDVVIDANVFYDLHDPTRNGAEESLGLTADWLADSIRLCVTDELFNEIHRQQDRDIRDDHLRAIKMFDFVVCNSDEFQAVEMEVRRILGEPRNERDASDLRQLARAISARLTVFVTRDEQLLEYAERLYEHYGFSVLRPAQLIGQFDELRHERLYQRERLAGTTIRKHRISYSADVAVLFHDTGGSEKLSAFQRRLRSYSADPDRFSCFLVSDDSMPTVPRALALFVVEYRDNRSSRIPLFRFAATIRGSRISSTLFQTLLARIVENVSESGSEIVILEDADLDPGSRASIIDAGFIATESGWVKPSLRTVGSPSELGKSLALVLERSDIRSDVLGETVEILMSATIRTDPLLAGEIEHRLWPAKILGCGVPSYIVPIRPRWASDLFDSGLGHELLWGSDAELALNPQSVYYRACRPCPFRQTGRILWYVSEDELFNGSKRLRACSRLVEVVVGTAKDLYRQFRRFGVYDWRDVLGTADGDPTGEIMALRFDDSERLGKTRNWDDLRAVLLNHGNKSNLQSPVMIPEEAFVELYGEHSKSLSS